MLAALVLAGCSEGRREVDEARRWFEARYPGVPVEGVRISEDEVVARSIEFTYRSPDGARTRSIRVQFMEDSTGAWVPRPSAPAELP